MSILPRGARSSPSSNTGLKVEHKDENDHEEDAKTA